jgi:endonuclease G
LGDESEAEDWVELTEEDLINSVAADEPLFEEATSATRPVWAKDDRSPDYAHLRAAPVEAPFELEAEDLALLAELNDFPVDGLDTPLLFGLRGCGIVRATGGIVLKDQRPDHITPRCTLGVWSRSTGQVAVFQGSTVPDRRAVLKWKQTRKAGNLLATGLYGYIIGAHATIGKNGKLNARPGCFLLRETADVKREVIVRRSADDLSYELTDVIDRSRPGDNIHPTFFTAPTDFSSFGCQTVVGFADNGGNHRGPWADFRRAAGMTDADGTPGARYRYMLLTGAEARFASELRRSGLANDPQARRRLRRLRFGSRSEAVKRLQSRLKLAGPDGSFGPNTAAALYSFQQSLSPNKEADGIFTPHMDESLGFEVFSVMGT